MNQLRACECADPGCPDHPNKSLCTKRATVALIRGDWAGNPRCFMCDACAEDALALGVFYLDEDCPMEGDDDAA